MSQLLDRESVNKPSSWQGEDNESVFPLYADKKEYVHLPCKCTFIDAS